MDAACMRLTSGSVQSDSYVRMNVIGEVRKKNRKTLQINFGFHFGILTLQFLLILDITIVSTTLKLYYATTAR